MEGFETNFTCFHDIDLDNNIAEAKEVNEGDLQVYISELIKSIVKREDNRFFTIKRESTEVVASLSKAISGEKSFSEISNIIAERLLGIEKNADEKYKHLNGIKPGSLVQAYLSCNEEKFYLIAKIEHNAFIDQNDLLKHIGLPFEKQALKMCFIKYSEEDEILEIVLDDTNPKISQYWWEDFLELKELNSNEKNTQNAFKVLDHQLKNQIMKKAPKDYTVLRNSLVGYFKSQEYFSYETMINTVFGNYSPQDPDALNIENFKAGLSELPEKKKFDRKFEIVPRAINARIKSIVPITESIDLTIKDSIHNIEETITSQKEDNGDMFIIVKTDSIEAYNKFKSR